MNKPTLFTAILLIANFCFGEPLIKSGESIAFLGDSITQFGAGQPSGYVREVISGLKVNGIDVKAIPAGISGNKSNQMLARLEKSVISKKPTWMTLSCGVNDVWHGKRGIPLEQYKINIRKIVDQTQQAGIKVMILTATMITENKNNPKNLKLDKYNDFLRRLAKEKNCILVDLNQAMKDAIEKAGGFNKKKNHLTRDGVHMDIEGDMMMAKGILQDFGLTEEMIDKAVKHWESVPNSFSLSWYRPNARISIQEKRQLEKIAAKKGITLKQMLNQGLQSYVDSELKNNQ